MKISIKNFKSIDSLEQFDLKPLTILSGNNSSGKSSFIQLLLLLKQSLELSSSKFQIITNGEYLKVKDALDLIRGKDIVNMLSISFSLTKNDFSLFDSLVEKSLYDSFKDYKCNLNLSFFIENNELIINNYFLEYTTEVKTEFLKIVKQSSKDDIFVQSNNKAYFIVSDIQKGDNFISEVKKVNYSSFFPISFEEAIRIPTTNPKGKIDHTRIESITRINNSSIKSFLEVFFSELQYIGPLREEPKDSYMMFTTKDYVGSKGEYTAQILELRKDTFIHQYESDFSGGNVVFKRKRRKLIEAVNFWMCKVFLFGKSIAVKETGDSYIVYLINYDGVQTTLKHVGFGISQILPIIVQGLLLKKGATLILEQPEIHLHPKIQSLLFDFIYSLILEGKKIIVETHSDHLITRLRRRVAEDGKSQLQSLVNLTFIEKKKNGLEFNEVKIDDLGIYNIFPEDFIENPETEMLALLDAQMKKRKLKRL